MERKNSPTILNKEQVEERLASIEAALATGKFEGSGNYWGGIRGDIENLFGWHGPQSPQTDLTPQQRVNHLVSFINSAEIGCEAMGIPTARSPVMWLEEITSQIKRSEASKLLDDQRYHSNPTVQEIREIDNRINQIKETRSKDTHPIAHQLQDAKGQDEIDVLTLDRDQLLVALYDAVF